MGIYADKEVLVTGGLGFIGSNLARALVSNGARVTLVDSLVAESGGNAFNVHDIRERVTIVNSDVRDADRMAELIAGKDFLFNLAAQTSHVGSMQDPHTDLEVNTTAQLSMLEACRRSNPSIRIVFASTRQIYGKPEYLPVDERHPDKPVDVNGINKLAGEWYHLLYNNVYGIRSTVLRLTNTYGPGMRVKDARQTFIGIWLRLLLEQKTIEVFGDGRQLRDFNHVDECVEAFLLAGASDVACGKIYNIGNDPIRLCDLAQAMTELGYGGSYQLVPFPEERKAIDIGDYYSNSARIEQELGWQPSVQLAQGLKRTLEYYNLNREHYWDQDGAGSGGSG